MAKVNDEIWDKFINHCYAEQQLAEKTIQVTLRALRFLEKEGIDLMANEKELKKQVMEYFAKRLRKGATGTTLNLYVKSLNRWCIFRELKLKFKKYKEVYQPRRIPTTADIKRLLDACKGRDPISKRDRTLIYFMINTGLRREEVANLQLTDIDWENCFIRVRGKGMKIRLVAVPWRVLHGKTVPSIKNYIENWRFNTHKTALFTTKKGKITPNKVAKIIYDRGKRAGIPWIHPHALRHYYATNLLRAGVNIRIVQQLLGHADIKTTGVYLHVVENDLRMAVENENIEDPLKVPRRNVKTHQKSRGLDKNLRGEKICSRRETLKFYDITRLKKLQFLNVLTREGMPYV